MYPSVVSCATHATCPGALLTLLLAIVVISSGCPGSVRRNVCLVHAHKPVAARVPAANDKLLVHFSGARFFGESTWFLRYRNTMYINDGQDVTSLALCKDHGHSGLADWRMDARTVRTLRVAPGG